MKVILLNKITKLGNFGDQINVKSGYARNYLLPQGKAVPASKKNIKFFEERRAKLEAKLLEDQTAAKVRATKINALGSITIPAKAGDEGKLFGSIGARDIADTITATGISVTKREVRLPNGLLRRIGNHDVIIQVYNDIFATLNVIIIPKI